MELLHLKNGRNKNGKQGNNLLNQKFRLENTDNLKNTNNQDNIDPEVAEENKKKGYGGYI